MLRLAADCAGEFRDYHEPFLGGGALFFALAGEGRIAGRAFLSDANRNLMDAYLGVQEDVEAVIAHLREHAVRHGKPHFYAVREAIPDSLAARAARIVYLNRTCFNGLYRENSKGEFNVPYGRYEKPRILNEPGLRAAAALLETADLGAQPFSCLLERASEGDLVYCDPPYIPLSRTSDFTTYTPGGFGLEQHRELASAARVLDERGVKVILSNSLTDETRVLYRGFHVHRVHANRSVNAQTHNRGPVAEAVITNFPLAGRAPPGLTPVPALDRVNDAEDTAARVWLRANGYPEVAALIEEITTEWARRGKRTRRNWWEVLAGGAHGRPRQVAGRPFPVLKEAQLRQGLPLTVNAR